MIRKSIPGIIICFTIGLCHAQTKIDPKSIAETKGLIQVRDTATTEKWVDEALAANPLAVDTYKNNPKKKQASLGFLRGAVMKASAGKADPKLVGELLEKKLNA